VGGATEGELPTPYYRLYAVSSIPPSNLLLIWGWVVGGGRQLGRRYVASSPGRFFANIMAGEYTPLY